MPTKRLQQVNNNVGETVHSTEIVHSVDIVLCPVFKMGTAVAQWLRFCATNRKVAGSILACVIRIFH